MLTGMTATGKSDLAVAAALALGGEIVSADSAMVYRGLDIGTDKPSAQVRNQVRHHLIDIRDPRESFSVAEFVTMADEAIAGIAARGRVPIVAGGTGLYVRNLLDGRELPPVPPDPAFRLEMEARARAEGAPALHRALAGVDPSAAAAIHPANVRRVIRALEVHHASGRAFSSFWRESPRRPAAVIVCDRPREALWARIGSRVRHMLGAGLVAEVRVLLGGGVPAAAQSMRALGYKETVAWIRDGGSGVDVLADAISAATRRFAKRQRTWWRAMHDVVRLDLGEGPAEAALGDVLRVWDEG